MTTWIRTQPQNGKLVVVESSNYGDPLAHGYSMVFDLQHQFTNWLKERFDSGWIITFCDEADPLNDKTIAVANASILEKLKNGY